MVGDRALEEKPADSELEVRCADLLRHQGIEGWAFHHHVHNDGRFVAEPDFSFVDVRLAVEVDGTGKLRAATPSTPSSSGRIAWRPPAGSSFALP